VISGRLVVKMAHGTELIIGPGEVFVIPAGHDSWVGGDEPCVYLHLPNADDYAAGHNKP
jgi:quercetin dioxygenase-like cupin family protein